MKRVLIILFLVLSLLVSCASSQVKKPESKAEEPKIESTSPVITEDVENNESEPFEEPVEEEVTSVDDEPSAISDDSEQFIAEPEIIKEDSTEGVPSEASVGNADEEVNQDWSQIIGAAPSDVDTEDLAEVEETVENDDPAPLSETAAKAEPVQTEKPQSVTSAPRKASFSDRLTSFIKRIGNFIADQILMSIGFFVCFCGFIYLIVALIVSARRERQRAGRHAGKNTRNGGYDSESYGRDQDKDPENDDDFLRKLLGDDND